MSFNDLYDGVLNSGNSTFGEDVEYAPLSGGTFNITGVFEKNPKVIDPETQALVSTNQPMVEIKKADISAVLAQGDVVTIKTVAYTVTEIEDDDRGGLKIFLRES